MPLVISETKEDEFKTAMSSFASGVTVITLWDAEDRPYGMTASAFSSVSMDPFLVLICLNRSTRTYQDVSLRGRFGVNILDRSAVEISQYCARPGEDKCLREEWMMVDQDSGRPPALTGAIAYLDCNLRSEVEAGTHSVLLGEVAAVGLADRKGGDPLVYFQGAYRELKMTELAHA